MAAGDDEERATRRPPVRGVPAVAAVLGLLAGLGALVAGLLAVGPPWLPPTGSVVLTTLCVAALAVRTGARPLLPAVLAAAVGAAAVVLDDARLSTGTAVVACAAFAVLGAVGTVPARRFLSAAREAVLAMLLAALGALATVGFAPEVDLARFQLVSLGIALAATIGLVHGLGDGLHGLGRRGALAALAGGVVLVASLVYGELLRRYGTPDVVDTVLDAVGLVRDEIGAFPRAVTALVGVPALVWGCHLRARRRRGWWVCVFGVAATSATAAALVDPTRTLLESGLATLYGLVVGLALGYVLVRVDLALTGTRGTRGRRAERGAALRPEPARTAPLR